jgi:hypothetical protein
LRSRRRSRSATRAAIASSGLDTQASISALPDVRRRRRPAARSALGSVQRTQHRKLRHTNRIFGTPNFGCIFSAKSPREMQLGIRINF